MLRTSLLLRKQVVILPSYMLAMKLLNPTARRARTSGGSGSGTLRKSITRSARRATRTMLATTTPSKARPTHGRIVPFAAGVGDHARRGRLARRQGRGQRVAAGQGRQDLVGRPRPIGRAPAPGSGGSPAPPPGRGR